MVKRTHVRTGVTATIRRVGTNVNVSVATEGMTVQVYYFVLQRM